MKPPYTALVGVGILSVFAGCAEPGPDFREGLLPVRGTELFVRRVGQGEPVLVVHGGPVMEHGYLAPHLDPLSDEFEVIYFDQRVSGRSAGTVDSASLRLDSLAADMGGILDVLGLESSHLLAHSWGGLLALRFAILHPERVRSLTLVSPMAASAELWQREEIALAALATGEHRAAAAALRADPGLMAGDSGAIAALMRHAFRLQFHDPDRASDLELYVPPDYLERSRQFGHLAPDLDGYDFHDEAARLAVPTLILFGEDEPGGDIGGAALAGTIPGAEFVRLPGSGHFPFIETPDAFLSAVRDFITGVR